MTLIQKTKEVENTYIHTNMSDLHFESNEMYPYNKDGRECCRSRWHFWCVLDMFDLTWICVLVVGSPREDVRLSSTQYFWRPQIRRVKTHFQSENPENPIDVFLCVWLPGEKNVSIFHHIMKF